MAALLLHEGAQLLCDHAGQASPQMTEPRVTVSGSAVVTQATIHSVSGCGLSGTGSPPCATAQWSNAATRVRAGGVPVLLTDSQAICAPTGAALHALVTQIRAQGS
jgi:hypothetical protein